MSYVDNNLLLGEEVVYRARLHKIIFLPPVALVALGILVGVLVDIYVKNRQAAVITGAVLLVLAIIVAFPRFIRYGTSEFAVTNKRVIVKVGLFHRHTLELVLAKVETVGVDQTIPGRIFNYGTIIVTGTGGTQEPFKDIANPLTFRKQVQFELSSGGAQADKN
jgi:uncharacterized membrane protein YdbT with pleckstrin-like domain